MGPRSEVSGGLLLNLDQVIKSGLPFRGLGTIADCIGSRRGRIPQPHASLGRRTQIEVPHHSDSDTARVVLGNLNVSRERVDHARQVRIKDAIIMSVVDDPLALTPRGTSSEDPPGNK